jgi:hypothetical protein
MELMLVVTSFVSLVLAVVMSVVAWKLLRHGRLRTSARVETLERMALADIPADADPLLPTAVPEETDPIDDPWDLTFRGPDVTFGATVAHHSKSRRGLAFALVVMVVFLGVGSAYAIRSAQPISEFVGGIFATRPNLAAAEPLELLSLRHATTPSGVFTVTGLVHNPAEGLSLDNIVAVVYLFDGNGQYFASGRAHLDLPTFQPGDESPFVVTIPQATGVSRYRVGFRLYEGGVVGHVDRRGRLPVNTTGETLGNLGRGGATEGSDSRPMEG